MAEYCVRIFNNVTGACKSFPPKSAQIISNWRDTLNSEISRIFTFPSLQISSNEHKIIVNPSSTILVNNKLYSYEQRLKESCNLNEFVTYGRRKGPN